MTGKKKCLVQSQKGPYSRNCGAELPSKDHRSSKAKMASSLSPVPQKPGLQTSEDRYPHS